MTAREASIEGNRNRTVDISILVDEGQEAELLENFTAKRRRRLFLEEQLTVARLGQLRYWNFVEKSFSKTIENDDED